MAWRTQVRKTGLKYRIIWVTSHISQIFEQCFFYPLQQHFSLNKGTPYCFANVFTDLVPRIKKLREYTKIVVLDYSSFDQTVPPELILLFFDTIKGIFKINSQQWNIQYEAIKFYNTYCMVFNIKDGRPTIIDKQGSVSSGSVLTNFMDSWINLFLCNLYLVENNIDESMYYLNVMGDDCIHGFNFDFSIESYSKWLLVNFNMVVDPAKCQVHKPDFETIEFLGTDINENGRYIDRKLAADQMTVSHTFFNEEVMSEELRVISKAASICFKFSDGWKYFDYIVEQLKPIFNIEHLPEYYYQLFFLPSGPFEIMAQRSIAEDKYNGWMTQ